MPLRRRVPRRLPPHASTPCATRTSGRTSPPRNCETSWPRKSKIPRTMLYPREPRPRSATGLERQGRTGQPALEVPAVPIYIQEKIHPQAIIEDFRSRAWPRSQTAMGPTQPVRRLQRPARRVRSASRFLSPRGQLVESADPRRFAVGDDLAWPRRRISRARCR